jgi:hypothetical protein
VRTADNRYCRSTSTPNNVAVGLLDDQHARGGERDPDGDTPQEPSVTLVGGR